MTAPAPGPKATTLARRVLDAHRARLIALGEDHPRREFRQTLRLGIDALDQLAGALDAGDEDRARRVMDAQRRLLLGLGSEDGWETTALSWALFVLTRVDRALQGICDPVQLGLTATKVTTSARTGGST